jgi:hypothetical protein
MPTAALHEACRLCHVKGVQHLNCKNTNLAPRRPPAPFRPRLRHPRPPLTQQHPSGLTPPPWWIPMVALVGAIVQAVVRAQTCIPPTCTDAEDTSDSGLHCCCINSQGYLSRVEGSWGIANWCRGSLVANNRPKNAQLLPQKLSTDCTA